MRALSWIRRASSENWSKYFSSRGKKFNMRPPERPSCYRKDFTRTERGAAAVHSSAGASSGGPDTTTETSQSPRRNPHAKRASPPELGVDLHGSSVQLDEVLGDRTPQPAARPGLR